MVAVASHHNCSFELIVDVLLDFNLFWCIVWVALSLLDKSLCLLIDQVKTVVHGQIFRDVVNDQIKTALENPRRGEKSWPGLNGIVKCLGLWGHEEARIPANLAQFGIAHLSFDDWVDEVQGKGVIFHLHWVEIIESELRNTFNGDREFSAKIWLLSFKINLLVKGCCGENVIADANIVNEDALEFGRVCSKDFILLESFQMVSWITGVNSVGVRLDVWSWWSFGFFGFVGRVWDGCCRVTWRW